LFSLPYTHHRVLHSFPTRRSSDLVLVSSASLIIILSFYNGLEKLIFSMYSAFTPELRIEPAKGKGFVVDSALSESLKNHAAVARSEEHTSELQSRENLVCRLLLEK